MCASDYYVRNYVCIRPLYSLFYMYFRSFATCVLILFVALAHILWAEETASGVSSPLGRSRCAVGLCH